MSDYINREAAIYALFDVYDVFDPETVNGHTVRKALAQVKNNGTSRSRCRRSKAWTMAIR